MIDGDRTAERSSPASLWVRLLAALRLVVRRLPPALRDRLAFYLRLPLGGSSVVVTTDDGFRFLVWDLHELLQRYVFWTGTWEPEETRFLRRTVGPGASIVDVGAQLGHFTLAAAHAVGATGRVIAVEPMAVNRERLHQNLALNGCDNVVVVEEAAGARTGTARFASRADRHQTGWGGFAETGDVEVPIRTLDEILAEHGVTSVDFLKVDVEGGEPDVLEGATRLLDSPDFHGPVLIEINELRLGERGHSGAGVIATLTSRGFREVTIEAGLDPERGDRNLVFVR